MRDAPEYSPTYAPMGASRPPGQFTSWPGFGLGLGMPPPYWEAPAGRGPERPEIPGWASYPSLRVHEPPEPSMTTLGGLFPGAGIVAPESGFLAPLPAIHDTRPTDHIHDIHGMMRDIAAGSSPAAAQSVNSRLDPLYIPFMNQFRAVQEHMESSRRARYEARHESYAAAREFREDRAPQQIPVPQSRPPSPPTSSEHHSVPPVVDYDGDDRVCSICGETFAHGDGVLRLVCRHVFHVECWNDLLARSEERREVCPNCRGSGRITARFRFIGEPQQTPPPAAPPMLFPFGPRPALAANPFLPIQHVIGTPESQTPQIVETHNVGTSPAQSPRPSQAGSAETGPSWRLVSAPRSVSPDGNRSQSVESGRFHTPNTPPTPTALRPFRGAVFPWYPAEGVQPAGYYHQSTALNGGRMGILVDPGAWTNLAGEKWAKRMSEIAMGSGHKPEQFRMNVPLHVQGVGSGFQSCDWRVKIPIAVLDPDGAASCVHTFEAPTVGGTGSDLPALLGLRSMRDKRAVLEMTPGKECLSFPGEGGYEIKWSPGTMHCKLEQAPSGHLILPCGEFHKLAQRAGGLVPHSTTFHATPPEKERVAASAGSGAAPRLRRRGARGGVEKPTLGPAGEGNAEGLTGLAPSQPSTSS